LDPIDNIISDKKLEKLERESYKHSFLIKYMERTEEEEKLAKTERLKEESPKKPIQNK
jgi:hypothetical protein